MRIVESVCAAIGSPQALREVNAGSRVLAVIGRWRHNGADVDFGSALTGRLILNVSGGHSVKVRSLASARFQSIRAGSIQTLLPGDPTSVVVLGKADSFHIFISRGVLEAARGVSAALLYRKPTVNQKLQSAALRAFVALVGKDDATDRELRHIVHEIAGLLAAPTAVNANNLRGGLSAESLTRVHELVNERLEQEVFVPPRVSELAATVGLTSFHFIRAYSRSAGRTPHADVAARRMEAALTLVLRGDVPVDEVGERLGYSSPSHFIRSFREQLGVTPGAIQRALRS